jgi:thioredoxin-related protein
MQNPLHPTPLSLLLGLTALLIARSTAPRFSNNGPQSADIESPWVPFREALERAKRYDKKVLVFVDAPWCGWCKKMEASVFEDPKSLAAIQPYFELARIGWDDSETHHRYQGYRYSSMELAQKFGAIGTPTTVFLDAAGRPITHFASYAAPAFYLDLLRYIGSDAYLTLRFEEFSDSAS